MNWYYNLCANARTVQIYLTVWPEVITSQNNNTRQESKLKLKISFPILALPNFVNHLLTSWQVAVQTTLLLRFTGLYKDSLSRGEDPNHYLSER